MSLISLSRLIIFLIGLLTAVAVWQLKEIRFDYEVEKFFPAEHESTQFFRNYQKTFGSDNDYLLIGIEQRGSLFDPVFLREIDHLSQRLDTLSHVVSVLSPTNVRRYRRSPLSISLRQLPYLHLDDPQRLEQDSLLIYEEKTLIDFLFAEDRHAVAIWLKHTDLLNTEGCLDLYHQVNAVLADFDFEKVHVAGKCFGQSGFISIIQREVGLFTALNILLIALFLWLSYRKIWGIILPLIVVGITVLWTLGILTAQGNSIDIIGNLIPTILLVIGISDTVHFLTHYLRNLKTGLDKWPALKQSIQEVGLATMLTTFTTAIGFLTLTSSDFQSLIDLGIYATLGLVFALLLTYSLLPALLMMFNQAVGKASSIDRWDRLLNRLFDWVLRHNVPILLGTGACILVGLLGSSRIVIDNYLLEDLRRSHPMQQDFFFFADKFAGARPFELYVELTDSSRTLFDAELLEEINEVDAYLAEVYGVKSLISPASIMKKANQILHYGSDRHHRLPSDSIDREELKLYVNNFFREQNLRSAFSSDGRSAKISGKIPDWGSYVVGQKDAALLAYLTQQFPQSLLRYRITGTANLMDLNTRNLAWNVLQGLLLAVIIVGILMGVLVRSFAMVWISLLPNLLPLLMIAGIMGFAGIDLKISTSIIFVISFGIAVDDSIHFLSRFRRESSKHPFQEALRQTYLSTGKAIVSTSFILSGGFLVLCFSDFLGTFYIGLLISATLFLALLADLILLPVLLQLVYKDTSP
ncbi:MAG: MMPL family transporter [Bacteroidota bacterium]